MYPYMRRTSATIPNSLPAPQCSESAFLMQRLKALSCLMPKAKRTSKM